MTKWISNVVKVYGNKKLVSEMFDFITGIDEGGDDFFDFNRVIKMPEDLNVSAFNDERIFQIASDKLSKDVIGMSQKEFIEVEMDELKDLVDEKEEHQIFSQPHDIDSKCFCRDEIAEGIIAQAYNLIVYGCMNWYYWSIENWGTKWNSSECDIDKEAGYIYFETAELCPRRLLRILSALFPNLDFQVWYGDKDCTRNYWGMYSLSSGYESEENFLKTEVYSKLYGETFVKENMSNIREEEHV